MSAVVVAIRQNEQTEASWLHASDQLDDGASRHHVERVAAIGRVLDQVVGCRSTGDVALQDPVKD